MNNPNDNGWIGVAYALPATPETVIILLSIQWRMAGQYRPGEGWAIGGISQEHLAHIDAFPVAWQPMPAAPLDDSDDDSVWWDKWYRSSISGL